MEKTIRFFLPASILFLFIAYFRHPNHIGIDVSMYLQIGQFLLAGMKPYIDFVDINPPLIMYLNMIPAFLAKFLAIPIIVCFKLILVCQILLLSWCLKKILRSLNFFSDRERKILISLFIFLSAFLVYFRGQGQREHLFILAFVPFFYLRLGRYGQIQLSTTVATATGFFCGLYACFKPHFLFLVLINELALILIFGFKHVFKKSEVFAFIGSCLSYFIFLLLLPSEVLKAFFSELVPLIFKHYDSFNATTEVFIKENGAFLIYGLVSALVLFVASLEPNRRKLNRLTAVAVLSALLIFVVQKKGWEYHLVPILFILGIAQICFVSIFRKSPSVFFRCVSLNLILIFSGYIIYGSYIVARIYINKDYLATLPSYGNYEIKDLVLRHSDEGDFVAIISPSSMYTYPNSLQANRYPASRYLFMFPMSFFNNPNADELDETKPYKYRSFNQLLPEEARFIKTLISDYQKTQPKIFVFVNYRQKWDFLPNNFDTFDYMNANGLWSHFATKYKLVEKEDNYIVYRLAEEKK